MHDPKVLFLAVGDSSLNFELRFHVRDITSRLDILSEFNFAIDKAFREGNIEIPFPQRDIHMHETSHEQPGARADDRLLPENMGSDSVADSTDR
jgi:small-conductance mechanosensitive channel